ncbi:MAG: class I SAM-dependent RNA methyltransferase, partial [Christensenellales bacterium]
MKLRINRLGINGEGVGTLSEGEFKDKVCFVDGALPNENIEVLVINNKKNFCTCKLEKILEKSKYRVEPPCKYFGVCGGCDIQHMNKTLQLQMKRNNVKDTILKIAGINVNVNEVVRLNDFAYRNKMVFPYAFENSKSTLGMFAKNSHKIVDIDKCLLANDNINKFLKISKDFFMKNNYTG